MYAVGGFLILWGIKMRFEAGIVGPICVFVFIALIFFILVLSHYDDSDPSATLKKSCAHAAGRILVFAAMLVFCAALVLSFFFGMWWVMDTVTSAIKDGEKSTPTILVCDGINVAESRDGFVFNSRSGTYEEFGGNMTYTPKQGATCEEFRK